MDLKKLNSKDLSRSQAFSLLREYLTEQIDLAHRKMESEDNFSIPSWAEYQAYQLGSIKSYQKLLSIIPDQGA